MSLFGTLPEIRLSDLLQLLAASHKTGRLQVVQNHRATNVFFRNGRVESCSADDPAKLLGQFLLFQGVITEDVLRRAMAEQEATGDSLRTILVSRQLVTASELERIVLAKAEETLYGLFDLEEATFSFRENVAPGPKDTAVVLDVADIVVRGMGRIAERQRIRKLFGDPATLPQRTDRPVSSHVFDDWPTRQVYKAADGERTVGEIVLQVHGTEFLTTRRLFDLHALGLIEVAGIRPRPVSPPVDHDRAREQREDLKHGILPLSASPTSPASAASDESGENIDRARALIAAGDPEAALVILGDAHRDDPSDSAVRRLIAQAEKVLLDQITRGGLSPEKVPVRIVPFAELGREGLAPAEEFILSLSDGSWDVRSLLWVSPMRAVEVASIVNGLKERGLIELRD